MNAKEALDLLRRHRQGESISHRLMIDADGAVREHASDGAYITIDEVREALRKSRSHTLKAQGHTNWGKGWKQGSYDTEAGLAKALGISLEVDDG